MTGYLLRRILSTIPILLAVAALTLVIFRYAGGDPASMRLGKHFTPQQYAAARTALGLDRPLFIGWPWETQYGTFLGSIATMSFGDSWAHRRPVGRIIGERIGPTLSLALPAFVLSAIFSIAIGLLSAYFRGRWFDSTVLLLAVAGISISSLLYVIVGQYLLAYRWKLFPIWGYASGVHAVAFLALPVAIWIVVSIGANTRYFRSVFLEEIRQDYVRTARAKGLRGRTVLFVHVLRNALIPIITRLVIQVPFLMTGALVLEVFFGIPGLGSGLFEAINNGDLPVVKAFVVVGSILYVTSNVLSDLLYVWVDPRVRLV